jgi:ATP-binding cassette subfamily B protein
MKPQVTASTAFWYILRSLKPFPLPIVVMFCAAVISAASVSVTPYLMKIILNRITEDSAVDVFAYLATPVAIYLGMHLLMGVTYRSYDYFVTIHMIPRLRKKLCSQGLGELLDKSHNYFQNNFSGSLAAKVGDITGSVPDLVQMAIDKLFNRALTILVATLTLWIVSYKFALLMFAWTSLFSLGAYLYSERIASLAAYWANLGAGINGKTVDILSNILSVRLFSAKEQEKESLALACDEAVAAEEKLQWSFFWMWTVYALSSFVMQCANFYFLLSGRQQGSITVGDFALVLMINIFILDMLWQVAQDFSQFSKLTGRVVQALTSILDPEEMHNAPGSRELAVTEGKIVFDQVKFHYGDTEPLFQNKSVTIEPGQKVGLVGYSGGGKTTFVNLILRLYNVTDGRILIDNQDIRSVTQDSLRQAIGMIPQDPSLFHRSLMDNIRYGNIKATDDNVIQAAKRAYAHEFIAALKDGYASLVGERGVKLSGGQRQRIAIARAVLKNAPILILDEATSQLDSVTEAKIQESLWELMQGKTTIVIAHRLSTLLHMDRILVFEQGKITEDGTHQALLAKGGMYKTLWDAQVGGFLPDTN